MRRCAFGQVCAVEDVDFGGGDSAAVYFFDFEGRAEIEGGGGFVEDLGVYSGVDEGSEEHVATDAGEAVQIGDAHEGIVSWQRVESVTAEVRLKQRISERCCAGRGKVYTSGVPELIEAPVAHSSV